MPDVPDEASVTSSEAGSESPTAATRGIGIRALRTQSAETMAVADAIAQVAEVCILPCCDAASADGTFTLSLFRF